MRGNFPVNAEPKTAAALSDPSSFAIMKKATTISMLLLIVAGIVSFTSQGLRHQYGGSPKEWPAPWIDEGVKWTELGALPPAPIDLTSDSVQRIVELGKTLFFDPRLSSSEKISCATCHDPGLNWTDAKPRSIGHEGAMGKRNAPTIQNSWFYKKLFWDGRSRDLQDQAFAPIVSESEMNSDMPDVMRKLRRINGYALLFKKAFGSEHINPERMTEAIAVFEKSVSSAESRFDRFVKGDKRALNISELKGLHLFRTKARCMNCHNGPMLTDNLFHRPGELIYTPYDPNDVGLYKVTHLDADTGKFRTPSLRDVMRTGPWFHDGSSNNMDSIIHQFNLHSPSPNAVFRSLNLNQKERKDLKAFLEALSAPPKSFIRPVLPQ
jgi:cytochrome c peroxidase